MIFGQILDVVFFGVFLHPKFKQEIHTTTYSCQRKSQLQLDSCIIVRNGEIYFILFQAVRSPHVNNYCIFMSTIIAVNEMFWKGVILLMFLLCDMFFLRENNGKHLLSYL